MKTYRVEFIKVGREKRSWEKEFAGDLDADMIRRVEREAKRGGRLMSRCVEVLIDPDELDGVVTVGGFRPVGGIQITVVP